MGERVARSRSACPSEHVARRDIGESRKLGDRLRRLEHEVPRRIALPHGSIDRKLEFEVVKTVEFGVLEAPSARARRDRIRDSSFL